MMLVLVHQNVRSVECIGPIIWIHNPEESRTWIIQARNKQKSLVIIIIFRVEAVPLHMELQFLIPLHMKIHLLLLPLTPGRAIGGGRESNRSPPAFSNSLLCRTSVGSGVTRLVMLHI